jgi:protein-tyrosine phosphatase
VFNLRDIGGLAATGGHIRTGLLWRSNALVELGEAGHARIGELGIRTAVDLREPGERDAEPNDLTGIGVDVHDVSVIDGAMATPPRTSGPTASAKLNWTACTRP